MILFPRVGSCCERCALLIGIAGSSPAMTAEVVVGRRARR
jgi:hypothetical protein